MPGSYKAPPQRYAGELEGTDLQVMNPDGCSHDVHDGVGGAHLVKVDLVRRHAVDFPLRLRQLTKDLEPALFDLGIKGALPDHPANLLPRTLRLLLAADDSKPGGPDGVNGLLCDLKPVFERGDFF